MEYTPPDHGRIETRRIWTTTELNTYLNFPYVGQAFVIERESIQKKTGQHTSETAYGLTSRTPELADPQRSSCAPTEATGASKIVATTSSTGTMMEDRSRIRKGHGPENISLLVVVPSLVIKSKGARSVAQKMRELTRNTRLVFDYLRMTKSPCPQVSS